MNPCVKPAIQIGVNRKVVGEKGAIHFFEVCSTLQFAKVAHAKRGDHDK